MTLSPGWTPVTLGEICELKYGKGLTGGARHGAGFAVYGSNGVVGQNDAPLTTGPAVIVGRKGSFGEVHYSPTACWPIDTTYFVDDGATACDLRWLSYRLAGLGLKGLNKSAAVPGLNREDAYRQRLLLPPVADQRRIAEVLDQADALRAKRRQAHALVDQLARGIFLELFGDPKGNPKGWPERRLGELSQLYAGASLPVGTAFLGQEDGYLLVKVSDMNLPGNEIVIGVSQLWSDQPGARSATCPVGSILIPKRGASIATNKKRIVNRPSVLDPNLMGIRPDESAIRVDYLYAWFRAFNLSEITSGSSVPQLNKQDLAPLPVPVPPLDLQRAYADAMHQLDTVRTSQMRHEESTEHLFESLQQRAFAGDL